MRKPDTRHAQDQSSSPIPIADYFWIAGLDGQELLNSYIRLASETSRPSSYGLGDAIQEDSVAEQDSFSTSRLSNRPSHNGSRNSYQRLSKLSDEARLSMLSLDSNLVGSSSNRSSATIRAVPQSESRMSFAWNDTDFEKALSKFAADRDKFYLDLNLNGASEAQPVKSKPKTKTQKIIAEEMSSSPSRGLGSIRRHMSFKDMNSVKRQPSLARNMSVNTSRRMSSYNSVIPSPEALRDEPDLHPLKRKFEPVLLDRYPRRGSTEESARQTTFPEYVPMFAFPDDIQVLSSESKPRSTWHGFSMTAADNSRIHAMCIVLWIPMNEKTVDELEKRCEEWRRANLTEAERELGASLVGRLASERAKLSQLLSTLPNVQSGSDEREELEDEISAVEERINMMSDMLKPLLHGSTSKIDGLADGKTGLWIPRAYGIMGRDGSMVGLWKEWLRAITVPMSDGAILRVPASSPRIGMWAPLERYVQTLCVDSTGPTSSRTQIEIMVRDLRMYARKEAPNELPGSRTTDLYPLFRALSIPNIIILFEYVLAESRVILLSSHTSMLQLASKAIIELIWPLQWSGVYIPILPARLIQAIEAPCPYICGVDRKYDRLEYPDDDFVLVDLDKNEIQSTGPPFPLPKQQRRKLQSLLHLAAPLHYNFGVPPGPPAYIADSFPFDSFTTENNQIFSAVTRSTNLAKLASISSTSFGNNASSTDNVLRNPPIFNAFLQAGSTHGRSADTRPRTASTAKTKNSNPDSDPSHSPISTTFPPLPGTPISRNDSGYALQSSLREKRSGHFDSFSSRRSGDLTNAGRRPSLPFVKHTSNPSTLTDRHPAPPPAPSTYAPSTYAQSTLAASTIMPGFASTTPAHNTDSVSWIEGHCLELQPLSSSASLRAHCAICDFPPDELTRTNYRCRSCAITVHARCTAQICLPCPASFFPDQIRAAFARMFASLFYTHKKFLVPLTSPEDKKAHAGLVRKFDYDGFLRSLREQDLREWAGMMRGTQAFNEFIAEREMDPRTLSKEVTERNALFDAIVMAKRGRGGSVGRLTAGGSNLGRRLFSGSSSSSGGGGRGPDKDVLDDTSKHLWKTVAAVGGGGGERIDYGPAVMKGRDHHDVVTRVPAKLEDGFMVRPRKGTTTNGGTGRMRHRMNGLSMNAP